MPPPPNRPIFRAGRGYGTSGSPYRKEVSETEKKFSLEAKDVCTQRARIKHGQHVMDQHPAGQPWIAEVEDGVRVPNWRMLLADELYRPMEEEKAMLQMKYSSTAAFGAALPNTDKQLAIEQAPPKLAQNVSFDGQVNSGLTSFNGSKGDLLDTSQSLGPPGASTHGTLPSRSPSMVAEPVTALAPASVSNKELPKIKGTGASSPRGTNWQKDANSSASPSPTRKSSGKGLPPLASPRKGIRAVG
jgi:hypothetical protein